MICHVVRLTYFVGGWGREGRGTEGKGAASLAGDQETRQRPHARDGSTRRWSIAYGYDSRISRPTGQPEVSGGYEKNQLSTCVHIVHSIYESFS